MASRGGIFLTISSTSEPNSLILHDTIYGTHTITEPILIDLLQCPSLTRLKGVNQHGITSLLHLSPPVTRYEHSVGAFLLVRKVGGSLDEQIAALLHDVSHTVFSHVVDYALSNPGESFHETEKEEYLAGTEIPDLLTKYGISQDVLKEELYPLVERDAPRLCADRLDYALRDTVAVHNLPCADAKRIYEAVAAAPDAMDADRVLVLPDAQLALKLARAYQITDESLWCNPALVDMYREVGQVIGDMVRRQRISLAALWKWSDEVLWMFLSVNAEVERSTVIKDVEAHAKRVKENKPEGLRLPKGAKVRTIDPDVLVEGKIQPLSEVVPEWGVERQEYIARREAEREDV
ncbi:phosphoribosyl-aminoimidazole-succinocarboxamide synthase [Aspergillus steynii IBT 23096]|uniref:Phosphoribosyl-aminoimidazole-succinocarboxamide synthase n=1 Tax=Aspergillus steynii IBT 23096 TaxID=1392250 RepID=A0A2I2G9V3_9EURO|nr:phosphoribosyl-aminoimidazole-succinocarboxamide synthase [Aspergillus steynii IBT 23096]PLB49648.1 phosphoribosyl-aminoimidazole-succinocarboxamide synthase [Aspergillus steynii IBT 23096]